MNLAFSAMQKIFVLNETGNISNIYKFSDADGLKNLKSGYSFGLLQYDVNANPVVATNLLTSIGFTKTEIQRIMARDAKISDLQLKLQTPMAKSIIDKHDKEEIGKYITYILTSFNDLKGKIKDLRTFVELIDFHNQFHMNVNGGMHTFLKTIISNGKTITAEDIKSFKLKTKYGQQYPKDVNRRFDNITSVSKNLLATTTTELFYTIPDEWFYVYKPAGTK